MYGVAIRGLILYTYIIIIVCMLLLRSGNVELNPGPVNCKRCQNCLNETVPIMLKVCACGYVFHKKTHREPPKCRSIPLTTVTSNVVTDNDDVPVVQSQPEFVSSNLVVETDIVNDSESPIPESKKRWVLLISGKSIKSILTKKEGVNTGTTHRLLKQNKEKHTRAILCL